MSEIRLQDAAARERVKTDLRSCLLVEAGAGSGKTSSLVARMASLVREGECRISRMAAVTFTRKAAAEMKARFHLELEKELANVQDTVSKENLRRGLHDIDSCTSFPGSARARSRIRSSARSSEPFKDSPPAMRKGIPSLCSASAYRLMSSL